MATSIIKKYYDGLKEHRILATKCESCNGYTFPPTTACEHCGSSSVAWVELSGKGTMLYMSHGIAPPPNPRFAELAPYCYGHVQLAEGVFVQGIVTNVAVDPAVLTQYYERGPIEVDADIIEVQGLPVLAFKVV
ncbi:MAG: zinc ribbon domain-containing protein [Candidatus Nanopelagicales bacterium]|jgi:uncharacterized OB-fold protein|nr:zinc ribbon domain-containing protein [Candidatus Nanopelagicales bacterium]